MYGVIYFVCSLVKALTSGHYQSYGTQGENITDGIDITNWKVQEDDQEITFSVWDFAGQTVYYNTHQVLNKCTVEPVCNDHLYNKIYYLWFIQ